MGDSNLKFCNYFSIVDPSFWHKLCQIKLDDDMLSEKERTINATYLNTVGISIHVDYASFNSEDKLDQLDISNMRSDQDFTSNLSKLSGTLINYNTLDSFKNLDKNQFIATKGSELWETIVNGKAIQNPSILNSFILITFAELKSYDFYYWFCFPALSALNFTIRGESKLLQDRFDEKQIRAMLTSHSSLSAEHNFVFATELVNGELISKPLEKLIKCTDPAENENFFLCFIDPSTQELVPGWPLRNILALISYHRKINLPVNVIALRIGVLSKSSFVVKIDINGDIYDQKWVGWERNHRGKFGPRNVNLKDNIDPVRLADNSVDLNLKLMKWRLVQDIDLEIVKSQKCLLLGAGTLGCSLARCLMGWGIRHITFVDNGSVSFSNPVRQSLYNYEDIDVGNGAKKKAEIASSALKKILPTMVSSGYVMDIPMPGHSSDTIKDVDKLHKLIEEHDAVFLLTDSRESRWLPTVIGSSLDKLVFTVALGFDSYLAMRHGVATPGKRKLGCYFCNDVTAPGNSRNDRTLDQQCTVTRPGVSCIASSLAVEVYISLLQHQEKGIVDADKESILGTIPHSIRGFLSNFTQIMPSTPCFDQCIACSEKVKDEYVKNKNDFLTNVFKSSTYLETLMGLDILQKESEMADILELSDLEDDS